MICRYLVTHLMGADLNNIVKCQKLTDDHVQFLIYQILRGLKVSEALSKHNNSPPHWCPVSTLFYQTDLNHLNSPLSILKAQKH